MDETTRDPCISFHVDYYADPNARTIDLLEDAGVWLQSARGITDILAEAVSEVGHVSTRNLSQALIGITTLIDMGSFCASEAHRKVATELGIPFD